MIEFFRFPHTPHLAWLGGRQPRDDKVLSTADVQELLRGEVVIEEKVDGANVGFSLDARGNVRAQNRGSYLEPNACHPQFKPLFRWLEPRASALREALRPGLMLFGEWCWAVHSVRYLSLPDWFLAFDVLDRMRNEFWSTERRDALAFDLGLATTPQLTRGHYDVPGLISLLGQSRLGTEPMEGLYVRHDEAGRLIARAKLVRAEFTQAIEKHWTRRRLEMNQRADGASWH
ncbi:MAG: RNA ligase family protein [Planctomycetes bacterium]|nr:RNA ligase family protein [Planctomycetota bacterium]